MASKNRVRKRMLPDLQGAGSCELADDRTEPQIYIVRQSEYLQVVFCMHHKFITQRMISNNDISRMSRMSKIVDHNIYLDTDSLYDPLRNTLRKSAIGNTMHVQNLDMRQSRIARNMRSLSPLQAEQIKNSIYIPVNRRLIPTHNIEKVQGKRFYAVNYEQKIHQPLSEQEFQRVAKPVVDEIIYEVGDQNPYYDGQKIIQQRNPRVSPRYVRGSNIVIQQPYVAPTSRSIDQQLQPSMKNLKVGSPIIPPPTTISRLTQQHPSISNLNTVNPPELKNGDQSYNFSNKKQMSNNKGSTLLNSKYKQDYKYNLFSIIDEAGNTGCKSGCCAGNEIIASKRKNQTNWF